MMIQRGIVAGYTQKRVLVQLCDLFKLDDEDWKIVQLVATALMLGQIIVEAYFTVIFHALLCTHHEHT